MSTAFHEVRALNAAQYTFHSKRADAEVRAAAKKAAASAHGRVDGRGRERHWTCEHGVRDCRICAHAAPPHFSRGRAREATLGELAE